MRIMVTQKDIDEGERCNGFKCPISLAASRATGRKIVVGTYLIFQDDPVSGSVDFAVPRSSLPNEARWFIYEYDQGLEVKPFTFEEIIA